MYKLYLDNCCYSRLSDDRTQITTFLECEAIKLIFEAADNKYIKIVGSEMLVKEIDACSDERRKIRSSLLLIFCSEFKQIDDSIMKRSKEIRDNSNIHPADSIHLACAESMNVDALITTDYRFIRMASNITTLKVINPIDWIKEVSFYDGN